MSIHAWWGSPSKNWSRKSTGKWVYRIITLLAGRRNEEVGRIKKENSRAKAFSGCKTMISGPGWKGRKKEEAFRRRTFSKRARYWGQGKE